jgi:hypothetical protein
LVYYASQDPLYNSNHYPHLQGAILDLVDNNPGYGSYNNNYELNSETSSQKLILSPDEPRSSFRISFGDPNLYNHYLKSFIENLNKNFFNSRGFQSFDFSNGELVVSKEAVNEFLEKNLYYNTRGLDNASKSRIRDLRNPALEEYQGQYATPPAYLPLAAAAVVPPRTYSSSAAAEAATAAAPPPRTYSSSAAAAPQGHSFLATSNLIHSSLKLNEAMAALAIGHSSENDELNDELIAQIQEAYKKADELAMKAKDAAKKAADAALIAAKKASAAKNALQKSKDSMKNLKGSDLTAELLNLLGSLNEEGAKDSSTPSSNISSDSQSYQLSKRRDYGNERS